MILFIFIILFLRSFIKVLTTLKNLNQINKNKVNITTLDKKKISKIGLNCLLAVSQGSKREPMVMEFTKKNSKKSYRQNYY